MRSSPASVNVKVVLNGEKSLAGAGALTFAWKVVGEDPDLETKVAGAVVLGVIGYMLFDDYKGGGFGPFGDPSLWTTSTEVPSALPTPQGEDDNDPGSGVRGQWKWPVGILMSMGASY